MEPVDPAGARPVNSPFGLGSRCLIGDPWPRPIGASLFGGLLSLFRGFWLTVGSLALFLTSSGAQEDLDRGKTPRPTLRIRLRDVSGAGQVDATLAALRTCEQVLEEYAARVYAEEGEDRKSVV